MAYKDLSETEKTISELEHLDVLDANTDEVEGKLDKIDANTDQIESKLDTANGRLSTANVYLGGISGWMIETEQVTGALTDKLNTIISKLDTIIHNQES